MKSIELTNSEFTLLSNVLNKNLFYLRRSFNTWQEVYKVNPTVKICIEDTEKEISDCAALIEKISSVRGF
uniref:Uncharacterized protein n=1 Tax=Dulem virus 253 TaxID=3145730 RepID=A0AAU8AZ67_9VIRU